MKATYVALLALSMGLHHISASPLVIRNDDSSPTDLQCNKVGWDAGTESFDSIISNGYTA